MLYHLIRRPGTHHLGIFTLIKTVSVIITQSKTYQMFLIVTNCYEACLQFRKLKYYLYMILYLPVVW